MLEKKRKKEKKKKKKEKKETQSVPLRFKGFWLHLFLRPAMILYIQRYVFLIFYYC